MPPPIFSRSLSRRALYFLRYLLGIFFILIFFAFCAGLAFLAFVRLTFTLFTILLFAAFLLFSLQPLLFDVLYASITEGRMIFISSDRLAVIPASRTLIALSLFY